MSFRPLQIVGQGAGKVREGLEVMGNSFRKPA